LPSNKLKKVICSIIVNEEEVDTTIDAIVNFIDNYGGVVMNCFKVRKPTRYEVEVYEEDTSCNRKVRKIVKSE